MENFRIPPNPFLTNNSPAEVYITSGCGAYENTRNVLSKINLTAAKGKKVLLKPNAGRMAKVEKGITTHPEAVAAAIDAFREIGADVTVGESPISGVKTPEAFEITGIADVCRKRNCPMIDLDERMPVDVAVPDWLAIKDLKVCADILEQDIIVTIPVMKMHMHTKVTLGIKNMKGCLWRRSKVKLHMLPVVEEMPQYKPIDIAISDMSEILKPHLCITDGYVCMEGLGPSAGDTKKLDIAMASVDTFACDAVACKIMGLNAEDVPHLKIAGERGIGNIDLNKIKVSPDNWHDFISPFMLPPENIAIDFPGVKILDKNSCSACQSTLLLFLKRYGNQIFDYFPDKKNICMAIGKGHGSVPDKTICIGNCTIKHKDNGIFIKGCPPVASEILSIISGHASFDTKDGTE